MKTQFERDNYKFEPGRVIHFTGTDGRPRLVRPWRVYQKHGNALGGIAWMFVGTRFYSPRTPKKDIQ